MRRRREDVSKLASGFHGRLDSRRRLGHPQLVEPKDERIQVSSASGVGGNLAERSDRHGFAELHPAFDRSPVTSNGKPTAPAVGVVERTQVDARTRQRLGRDDPGNRIPRLDVRRGQTGDSLHVVGEAHVARISAMSSRTAHARELFAPLGPSYDRVGATLSLGQDPRWRRFLVSCVPADGGHVLDVATGTGLVAAELLRRGFRVTGLDQSEEMLEVARRRLGRQAELVLASAESMPFPDACFDHLTVTYLLRYVEDPGATLAELARVVRPGGVIASLEFGVPRGLARPLWDVYVGIGLPVAGRLLRNGWGEVGGFLGGSIRSFWARYPLERQLELWRAAGLQELKVRRLSLGGGVVIWGSRS